MKTSTRIIAGLLCVALFLSFLGCYGSFALTKKVYDLNGSIGDKFINTLVMWVFMILPVYEAAGFIDLVVLNTLEFWTGSNPMVMQDGDQVVKYATSDNKTYRILIEHNKINIKETAGPDAGKAISISYSPETGNWTMNDGKVDKIIANLNQSNLKLMYPNGDARNIKLAY
jgi:hypothetical protein